MARIGQGCSSVIPGPFATPLPKRSHRPGVEGRPGIGRMRTVRGAVWEMRIHLIAVGTRMARWVEEGFAEYQKRLPPECSLRLIEIPAVARGKGVPIERVLQREGERLIASIPPGAHSIALDLAGNSFSTAQLARELGIWLQWGQDLALLVGGAEGLSEAVLTRARGRWSLSPLTFPHPLVRVIVAEQIYRAWSLLHHHPYHRA